MHSRLATHDVPNLTPVQHGSSARLGQATGTIRFPAVGKIGLLYWERQVSPMPSNTAVDITSQTEVNGGDQQISISLILCGWKISIFLIYTGHFNRNF